MLWGKEVDNNWRTIDINDKITNILVLANDPDILKARNGEMAKPFLVYEIVKNN